MVELFPFVQRVNDPMSSFLLKMLEVIDLFNFKQNKGFGKVKMSEVCDQLNIFVVFIKELLRRFELCTSHFCQPYCVEGD